LPYSFASAFGAAVVANERARARPAKEEKRKERRIFSSATHTTPPHATFPSRAMFLFRGSSALLRKRRPERSYSEDMRAWDEREEGEAEAVSADRASLVRVLRHTALFASRQGEHVEAAKLFVEATRASGNDPHEAVQLELAFTCAAEARQPAQTREERPQES